MKELQANTVTIVGAANGVATVLRTEGIRILPVLFPIENTNVAVDLPGSANLAAAALTKAVERGLLDDPLERRKFAAAGQAIVGTITRTQSTIRSLADLDNRRYIVSSEVWSSELPVLRRVQIIDVTLFQKSYQRTLLARANYNVIVARSMDYLDAVRSFFVPPDNNVTRQSLASVLAYERLFIQLSTKYLPDLEIEIGQIEGLQKQIATDLSYSATSQQ